MMTPMATNFNVVGSVAGAAGYLQSSKAWNAGRALMMLVVILSCSTC